MSPLPGKTVETRRCATAVGRLRASRLSHLPEGHPRPRRAALPQPARTLRLLTGPAAALAVHLRGRLPSGARGLDHPALQDLRALRGLHHARPLRHDPAVFRHAVVALHGLRPRDGEHAHAAGQPVPALVPAGCQAARRRHRVDRAGLRVSCRRLVLGRQGAAHRLSVRASGAVSFRHDAVRAGLAAFIDHQTAREFRRRHELCDLPDVFRLSGALSAVADSGIEPPALQDLPRQPLHLCRRTDPLRLLRADRVVFARASSSVARCCSSAAPSSPTTLRAA